MCAGVGSPGLQRAAVCVSPQRSVTSRWEREIDHSGNIYTSLQKLANATYQGFDFSPRVWIYQHTLVLSVCLWTGLLLTVVFTNKININNFMHIGYLYKSYEWC